jgi:hypothetical protein
MIIPFRGTSRIASEITEVEAADVPVIASLVKRLIGRMGAGPILNRIENIVC